MNKWDYNEIKRCCTAKETINKVKKQPTQWEKIFVHCMGYQELISRTYKELQKCRDSNK